MNTCDGCVKPVIGVVHGVQPAFVLCLTLAGKSVRSLTRLGNAVVFYGKDGDLTGPDREHAETSMLCLHLLQSALVHINTLLLQAVLEIPEFNESIGPNERRALTPLFWTHINPYGRFDLDMTTRLDLNAKPRESIL
jgi:hypothetical protein